LVYFQAEFRKQGNPMRQRHSHSLRSDARLVQIAISSLGNKVDTLIGPPAWPFNDVLLGTAGIPRCAPPRGKLSLELNQSAD
jgi:hypothetical protein